MAKTQELKIHKVDIADLKPAEYNPRQASKKDYKDLTNSIKAFGLIDPIIVNSAPTRKNKVIGGHFRLRIAQDLGYKTIPVVYLNIPDAQRERELNLRLNKNLGGWDFDLLANFDQASLKQVGFVSEELDKIFGIDKTVEDVFGTPKKAITNPGDLYQLGNHRLLCGDATKAEDAARLMAGAKGQIVFTDPPYNVSYDYDGKYKFRAPRSKRIAGKSGTGIFNDNQTPEAFYQFLLKTFQNYYNHTTDSMAIYICHCTRTQQQFRDAMKNAGFHWSQTIIWLKSRVILALGQDYHRVYEPILFGWKEGKKRYSNYFINTEKELWSLERKTFEECLDVWSIKSDKSQDYQHPTQKPVMLAERAITRNSKRGDIVLDFFGGSGSTLLAAEQLERKCYMMELDPVYCDVIVGRYEEFTKNKAVKLNGKKPRLSKTSKAEAHTV